MICEAPRNAKYRANADWNHHQSNLMVVWLNFLKFNLKIIKDLEIISLEKRSRNY